ncbi:MAG: hypothetical protein CTY39_07615 [Hyphomicrobium sp.]|nr:MAG: hypothetical protein CTY39_07615 [Hyphomicrobium sp.]
MRRLFKLAPLIVAVIASPAMAQESLQRLINAQPAESAAIASISLVRKSILLEAAQRLGIQAGLADRSKIILAEVTRRADALDARYRFQQLIIDAALLPPVIVETKDAVSLEASVMRVAKSTYRIEEPPRFVDVAPTWRDWLWLGLAGNTPPSSVDADAAPKDVGEKEFWAQELRKAYAEGERIAVKIFETNLATLNRAYDGMRTYYDLYERQMVSAPVLAASTDIVTMDDPNTISVGSTVFRVTVTPKFIDDAQKWVPLGR